MRKRTLTRDFHIGTQTGRIFLSPVRPIFRAVCLSCAHTVCIVKEVFSPVLKQQAPKFERNSLDELSETFCAYYNILHPHWERRKCDIEDWLIKLQKSTVKCFYDMIGEIGYISLTVKMKKFEPNLLIIERRTATKDYRRCKLQKMKEHQNTW